MRKLLNIIHWFAKIVFQRQIRNKIHFLKGYQIENILTKQYLNSNLFVNEKRGEQLNQLRKSDLFPTENLTNIIYKKDKESVKKIKYSKIKFLNNIEYINLLNGFIDNSIIPSNWKNEGLHYAGYIAEKNEWCLPSWIWTNAAIARYYFNTKKSELGIKLSDKLLELQLDDGGWMVRYDYSNINETVSPIIAPNDSAYIASNAMLNAYKETSLSKYLASAEKCAHWIMEKGHEDGMVMIGYDPEQKHWEKENNIVDVGFTADLFCNLFLITENKAYLNFAKSFIEKYINYFYLGSGKFATSINSKMQKTGGVFARGQAWALEGLIPYYKVSKDARILEIIIQVTKNLMTQQKRNGGWLYNLRPDILGRISGYDNKGIPVIASALIRCIELIPDEKMNLLKSINKSIGWCKRHTYNNEKTNGMILSNNFEGAIVHSFYTSTAFVYSNCYLIETLLKLKEIENDNTNT